MSSQLSLAIVSKSIQQITDSKSLGGNISIRDGHFSMFLSSAVRVRKEKRKKHFLVVDLFCFKVPNVSIFHDAPIFPLPSLHYSRIALVTISHQGLTCCAVLLDRILSRVSHVCVTFLPQIAFFSLWFFLNPLLNLFILFFLHSMCFFCQVWFDWCCFVFFGSAGIISPLSSSTNTMNGSNAFFVFFVFWFMIYSVAL